MNSISPYSTIIAKIIAKNICFTGETHINKHTHYCNYHIKTKFICKQCQSYSLFTKYLYICCLCHHKYCLIHFIIHQNYVQEGNELVHYWETDAIIIFDPLTKKKTKFDLPTDERIDQNAESISYKNKIYIIGGNHNAKVFAFSVLLKKMIPLSNMLFAKHAHALFNLHGFIYSIGGNNMGPIDDSEKYNAQNNQWKRLPKLIFARYNCAAFAWGKYIYAICGYGVEGHLNSMEKLCIEVSNHWDSSNIKHPLPGIFDLHAMPLCNGVLVIGGCDKKKTRNDCILLTYTENEWDSCYHSSLISASGFYWCTFGVKVKDHLYEIDNSRNIHILDLKTHVWTKIVKSKGYDTD